MGHRRIMKISDPNNSYWKKPLKYFSCLCEKDENSIVKQAFLISKQLDMENKKSYISELKTYLRETGCYDSDTLGFYADKVQYLIQ